MGTQLYTYNTSKPVKGEDQGEGSSLVVSNIGTASNRSAFGDLVSESMEPITQISAQYGLLSSLETYNATGGTVSTSDNMFVCTTGTNIGGYGVIRTKKPTIYREGQGLMARFTAIFDPDNAVANSLQFAGLFNVQDTIAFGYRGADFGIIYDTYGAQEIRKLTITGAGNGTLDLTLNSVTYNVPITTGTVEHNAYEIEAWMNANQSVWDAEQVDDIVVFRNRNAAAVAGTYSIGGSSGLTGSIAQTAAGTAKTASTILEEDWNGENVTFDKSKGNVFMIKVSYLGFGPISFFVMDSSGTFKRVHTIEYQNNNIKPSISNRALKVGWTAASLGSTTNITVKGASAGTFIEGRSTLNSESHASINSNTSVSTSFEAVLTIKALESFGAKAMLGRIAFTGIEVSTDSTKEVVFKISKNATLGETNFTYHEEGDSIALVDVVDHADSSNAHAIYAGQVGSGGSVSRNLKPFGIDLLANETLTVYAKVVSGSASDVTVTLIWKEDI